MLDRADRSLSNPFLSALGIAFLGLALAWLAVRFRLPIPAGPFLWVGFGSALLLLPGALAGEAPRQMGPRRARAAPLAVVGLLLFLPACFYTPFVSAHIANDLRLSAYAGRISDLPTPPGVSVIAQGAEVGVLTGNGDHCDYIATLVIEPQGDLTKAEVQRHFEALAPVPAVPGWGEREPVQVDVISGRLERGSRPGALDQMYIVQFVDAVYGPNGDWRCM